MATSTGIALPQPAEAVPVVENKNSADQVSQWTLMRWRFMQNRLSVFGLYALIVLYIIAIIAPFLMTYPSSLLDTDHAYAPPTTIKFINGRPSVCPLTQTLNGANFSWIYTPDCARAVPIRFFVHGFPYKFLGMFNTDMHLFGVVDVPPPPKAGATPAPAPAAAANDPFATFRLPQSNAIAQANAANATNAAEKPPKLYLFGADEQGRDLYSRLMEGSRISLTIGLVGVAISVILGSLLGTASGYLGGTVDNIIQRGIEILQSIPTLPLYAAFAAALPRNTPVTQRYFLITIILSFIGWTGLARALRGKVMAYRTLDYISAARLAGSSHLRIITTHMVPNAASHIIVSATLAVPASILGETALSFLGLGMLPPAVSWGVLLKAGQQIEAIILHPWLLIPAGAVIFTVMCWLLLGDGLRDAADPYSS